MSRKPPRLDLSPSSAARWMTCTASPQFLLENHDKLPENTDTVYSMEGTTAHAVAAAALLGKKVDSKDCPVPPDGEMYSHAFDYVEYVEALDEDGYPLQVEQKMPLWYMPGRNAIVDAAVVNDNSIHIIDYKYGAGVPVEAENNLQLAIYAISIIKRQEEPVDHDCPVGLHIYQPRGRMSEGSPFRRWDTTWGELKRIAMQIEGVAEDIQHGNMLDEYKLVFAPSDKACQWCPAKGFCSARQDEFTRELEPLAELSDAPMELPKPGILTSEQVAAVLKHKEPITKWLNDVAQYALDTIKGGGSIPGHKLVMSRGGNRAWGDPDEAARVMTSLPAITDELIYERKIISPAAAEKLIGKKKMPPALTDLIVKPPGQPVIAPLDDKRESCEVNALQEFSAHAD